MLGLIAFLVVVIVAIAVATMIAERRRKTDFSDAMRAIREIEKYVKEERK